MFKNFTKSLFGLRKSENTPGELIVDGEIIDPETGKPIEPEEKPSAMGFGAVEPNAVAVSPTAASPEIPPGDDVSIVPLSDSLASDDDPEKPLFDEAPAKPDPGFRGDDIPEGYLIYLGAANKAERTISEYQYELKWWNEEKPLEQITWRYIEKRINKLNPSTARRKIAALRSYARWQLREGYLRLHGEVSRVLPPKVPGRVPKDRGDAEFKSLSQKAMALCHEGDRRGIWIGLMLCCGLRISEIKGVELSCEQNIRVIGKGNKERLVPTPKWLYNAMADKNNKKWRRTRQLIWKELKDMGVKKPHSLRHTFASQLIRCDFQLEEAKELLGHAKLDTTLIYAKIQVPKQVATRLGVENG